jgi:hypothetical protein
MRSVELNRLNRNCSIEFSTCQLKSFTCHGLADERIFQALCIGHKLSKRCLNVNRFSILTLISGRTVFETEHSNRFK